MDQNFSLKTIANKIHIIISIIKWAWDVLLLHSFRCSPTLDDSCRLMHESDSSSADCAVCLCIMEAGEEVRELKCGHIFHRVCFDRWGGYGRWTCPLCRNHIDFDRFGDGETMVSHQVLVFNFSQIRANHNDTWWLR